MSLSFRFINRFGSKSKPSRTPGRNGSMRTSASINSFSKMVLEAEDFKLSCRQRFLRQRTSGDGGPGLSILTTSAPKSARSIPADQRQTAELCSDQQKELEPTLLALRMSIGPIVPLPITFMPAKGGFVDMVINSGWNNFLNVELKLQIRKSLHRTIADERLYA